MEQRIERKRVGTITSIMTSPSPHYGPTTNAHIPPQLPMEGSYPKYKFGAKASPMTNIYQNKVSGKPEMQDLFLPQFPWTSTFFSLLENLVTLNSTCLESCRCVPGLARSVSSVFPTHMPAVLQDELEHELWVRAPLHR